jgi:hypothetical protein
VQYRAFEKGAGIKCGFKKTARCAKHKKKTMLLHMGENENNLKNQTNMEVDGWKFRN